MNLHEPIDRFGSQSPRTRVVAFLAFGAVIIAVLGIVFYLGVTKGDSWAESKYLKQRDENLIRVTKAEAEQQRLAGVNDLLKKQNEDLAAERDKADKLLIAQTQKKIVKSSNRPIHLRSSKLFVDPGPYKMSQAM